MNTRRDFLKKLGAGVLLAPFVTSDLIARPPMNRLRHASVGTSGMAWSDINDLTAHKSLDLVAVADVDLSKTVQVRKKFPHVRVYQDWREMLEKERRNIDSVNVSTPDHMHAPIAMSAMQLGKHVYVQKPMAHNVAETRKLADYARAKGLVSQMGIQIQSTNFYRTAVMLIQAGMIGKVKEVHSWVPKAWGDPSPKPDRQSAIPRGLNWDGWLGVAEERPFIGDGYYHPSNWRMRLDFGTGTLGDMGCHLLDPVFSALKLKAPLSVRSEGQPPNRWNWPVNSRIRYQFAATPFTTNDFSLTWYDGTQKPPADILKLLEGDAAPGAGSIFVGTSGTMVLPHFALPILYPDARFGALKFPEVRGESHYFQFVDACLGKATTKAGFDYSAPMTEAVLLGTIALRFPNDTLQWDSRRLAFQQSEPNEFVRRTYRDGWKVRGL